MYTAVDGLFTATMDGMQIRGGEGIRFTAAGGAPSRLQLVPPVRFDREPDQTGHSGGHTWHDLLAVMTVP